MRTARLRFDIDLLAERLVGATDWLAQFPDTKYFRIGYFGASKGAAAALVAAAVRPDVVGAIVSRPAGPIWPVRLWRRCGLRHCLLSEEKTPKSFS
jgi:putative phosphoribosyl transferase